MSRKYRYHSHEFKLEAIKLLESSDKPVAQIARELGIRVNQIYKWRKQLAEKQDKAFSRSKRQAVQQAESGPEDVASLQAEVKRLREANERLEAEKSILKKAAAYFAKDHL